MIHSCPVCGEVVGLYAKVPTPAKVCRVAQNMIDVDPSLKTCSHLLGHVILLSSGCIMGILAGWLMWA